MNNASRFNSREHAFHAFMYETYPKGDSGKVTNDFIDWLFKQTNPRNCDVGTPDQQFDRFFWYCAANEEYSGLGNHGARMILRWAQMPCQTKEGEDNGKK